MKNKWIYILIGVLSLILSINIVLNVPKYNSVKKEDNKTYEIPKQEFFKAKVSELR